MPLKIYTKMMIALLFIVFLVGCQKEPEKLTIGLIPVRDQEEMKAAFEPIRMYLEETIGMKIEVTVADDYASLVEGMKNNKVDIGWYGAFSYIAAESAMDLVPLVVESRKETGPYYQSLIIASKDSGIHSVEALVGKRFAFVDPGSTSGFILPYALFKSRDINIEQNFSDYIYTDSHDQIPFAIQNNQADAGAISSIQYEKLLTNGKIQKDEFKIIWSSNDIPGSPFVARSDLEESTQEKFTKAMLNTHHDIPQEMNEFDSSIERYIEAESKHYNPIRNIATILGKDYMYEHFLAN